MRHISLPASGLSAALPALLVAAATASTPAASAAEAKIPANTPAPARLTQPLDVYDEIAALESMQFALTQVADGSTYVWHRSHGRLSGMVRPTSSFKAENGQVCRHIVVVLNGVELTKKTETIACRQNDGSWQIDG